jgi:hypothetical protein
MAGRSLVPVVLSADERAELERLWTRRKTAQAIALRARIVLAACTGLATRTLQRLSELIRLRWANGAGAFLPRGWVARRAAFGHTAHDHR